MTLATSCEELTHWKRLWCWEGLGAGGKGDDRGWDGWMASPTRWTWVWVNSRSWWWTWRPGVLWFMGSQRVGHDLATDLIWSDCWNIQWLLEKCQQWVASFCWCNSTFSQFFLVHLRCKNNQYFSNRPHWTCSLRLLIKVRIRGFTSAKRRG